jgi:hypothetical protein
MTGNSLEAPVARDHILRVRNAIRRDHGDDSMPSTQIESVRSVSAPSLTPGRIAVMSDDECMERLVQAVEAHDSGHLDQVAQLLGRFAVVIE